MLTNPQFLEKVKASFKEFINSGTSRSTAKLKPLHGAIASDIASRLGADYKVWAQGYAEDREKKIDGRYMDKMVDITIENIKIKKTVAGIAVKFVMQNYSQNSNNYFENMLGETANIRTASCPYFQIFIILDKLPYYQNSGVLKKWEEFTNHNMEKYYKLAQDNIEIYLHTPNKTLIYVVHIEPEIPNATSSKKGYMEFYKECIDKIIMTDSSQPYKELEYEQTVILNDYETFIEKVFHTIKAI